MSALALRAPHIGPSPPGPTAALEYDREDAVAFNAENGSLANAVTGMRNKQAPCKELLPHRGIRIRCAA